MSAAAIFGAGLFNAGVSAINNIFGRTNSAAARQHNYELNEMAASNADARTRALYKDFYSPKALLKQYQEAGLSPSLMFGGTPGQGGMSGAQGAGTAGQPNVYYPMSMLEAAQAANLMAQTEKTKAETEQVKPTSEATIASLLASAGATKAAEAATKEQTRGYELDNYLKEHGMNANLNYLNYLAEEKANQAQLTYQEARTAKVLGEVNEATLQEQIKLRKKEVEALSASILNTKAATELTKQQKTNLQIEMGLHVEEVCQGWQKLDIEQRKQTTYEKYVDKQCEGIEAQITNKLKELGLQKSALIVNGVINGIRAACMTAMTASSIAQGMNNTGNYIVTAGTSISQ